MRVQTRPVNKRKNTPQDFKAIALNANPQGADVRTETALDAATLRRYRQLEVLNRISSAANGLDDLDAILSIALDNVLDFLNSVIGGILLVDREHGTLGYRVSRGFCARPAEGIQIAIGEGISGKVAKTGEPILADDIPNESCIFRREFGGISDVRACVAVPLKNRNEIVGVIMVASHESGKYSADDLPVLTSIGDYLAAAIVRLRIAGKIKKGMERYQALLKYALNVQEDERKRLARELHDETSQALTSLTFRLQAAINMAEAKGFTDPVFIDTLQKAHASATQAGKEIVKLIRDLRPSLLDDLGMPTAIYRYAIDTLEPKGIKVKMKFIGKEHRLPAEVEVTFFRIAQGLISNILKHAKAKNVSIRVECDTDKALLHIEDDGIGFDLTKITDIEPSGRGAGLFTMRERLRLVGGNGHIESEPGKGTRITVTVPVVKGLEDLVSD